MQTATGKHAKCTALSEWLLSPVNPSPSLTHPAKQQRFLKNNSAQRHMCGADVAGIVWEESWHVFKTRHVGLRVCWMGQQGLTGERQRGVSCRVTSYLVWLLTNWPARDASCLNMNTGFGMIYWEEAKACSVCGKLETSRCCKYLRF